MPDSKSIDRNYLPDLIRRIETLPAGEASALLFEGSAAILFAGFPELAYQGFMQLVEGNLKISEKSSLAHPLKKIIPALCYLLKIPCPQIFSQEAMSVGYLESYMQLARQEQDDIARLQCSFSGKFPVDNWSDDFLQGLVEPNRQDTEAEQFRISKFLGDLQLILYQYRREPKNWRRASELLEVFDKLVRDRRSYTDREILSSGVQIYLNLDEVERADRYIQQLWHSSTGLVSYLFLGVSLPEITQRIAAGALRPDFNISEEQALEFIELVANQNVNSTTLDFIPTVEDWNNLLTAWERVILDNTLESEWENYEGWFPGVSQHKRCLKPAATEEGVLALEARLGAKLPLGYRNFLLAANGFIILPEYTELYDLEHVQWFGEENEDWIGAWEENDDLIEDEEYFQYGEHQDCGVIRGKYLRTALQISAFEDGYVYLLNPEIVDNRQEWEAWDFGTKLPGAFRYRSLWEMMQEVYQRSLKSFEESK